MVLGATLYGLYLCRKAHSKNIYETQKSIDEYMHFHYGNFESGSHGNWYKEHTIDDGFNFPVRCVILCAKHCSAEVCAPSPFFFFVIFQLKNIFFAVAI